MLLHAAGLMAPECEQAWRAADRFQPHWGVQTHLLSASGRRPTQRLQAAHALLQNAAQHGEDANLRENIIAARLRQLCLAQVEVALPEVVPLLVMDNYYLTGLTQEVLLTVYGDINLASTMDTMADLCFFQRWRHVADVSPKYTARDHGAKKPYKLPQLFSEGAGNRLLSISMKQ